MFSADKADRKVKSLSGGEKTRLLFALMTKDAPHILMLDEPTNHLDMDSRAALVEALNEYDGAVILVSHDSSLVRLVADQLWLVADGTCKAYDGDLDDYERSLLRERRGERVEDKPAKAAPIAAVTIVEDMSAAGRKDRKRADAETRQRLAPLRRALERAEKNVATVEAKRAEVTAKLADPALYEGSGDEVRKLQIEMGHLQRDLATAEEAWLAAQEALDTAQAEADAA
jgi:ATP-binding cassette subfamily F protein 3